MTAAVPFDLERLRDLVGPDDPATLMHLLANFGQHVPAAWQQLEQAVARRDAEAVGRHAHHVKGSVALIGCTTLVSMLQEWEQNAGAGDVVAMDEVAAGGEQLQTLLAAIDGVLESAGSTEAT